MSKKVYFIRALKLILSLTFGAIKITSKVIGGILRLLFKGFSKRLRFSITLKTATVYTLIFSTIFMVFSIVIASAFGFYLFSEAKQSLNKNSEVIIEFLNSDKAIPEAKLKRYAEIEKIDISVFDKNLEILYTSGKNDTNLLLEGNGEQLPKFTIGGNGLINLVLETQVKGEDYYLQINKLPTTQVFYFIVLIGALVVGFLLAVIITIVVGSRASKKMLRPIDDMIATARRISARDLNTRLNVVASHDELKDLAETLNEMLDRIQNSYEQQNRFVSDASHELRTPISVLQGYANLLQRWGKEDREVLEESIIAIKNEADNMNNLVQKLLFLARADKNTQKLEKVSFSLTELVEEVLKETKLIDSKHTFVCESNDPVTIFADRGLIKQALRIFIDNSIKFTPEGGIIKINSLLNRNKVKIIVEDTGMGIPKEDLPHIFNRFYKCDKSRTRNSGGTGLGLSIAKWIIEKHNGTIGAESEPAQGTKITCIIPTT